MASTTSTATTVPSATSAPLAAPPRTGPAVPAATAQADTAAKANTVAPTAINDANFGRKAYESKFVPKNELYLTEASPKKESYELEGRKVNLWGAQVNLKAPTEVNDDYYKWMDPDNAKTTPGKVAAYLFSPISWVVKKVDTLYTSGIHKAKENAINYHRRRLGFENNLSYYGLKEDEKKEVHTALKELWDEFKDKMELKIDQVRSLYVKVSKNKEGKIDLSKKQLFIIKYVKMDENRKPETDKEGNEILHTKYIELPSCNEDEEEEPEDCILIGASKVVDFSDFQNRTEYSKEQFQKKRDAKEELQVKDDVIDKENADKKAAKDAKKDAKATTPPKPADKSAPLGASKNHKSVPGASTTPVDKAAAVTPVAATTPKTSYNCWMHAGIAAILKDKEYMDALDHLATYESSHTKIKRDPTYLQTKALRECLSECKGKDFKDIGQIIESHAFQIRRDNQLGNDTQRDSFEFTIQKLDDLLKRCELKQPMESSSDQYYFNGGGDHHQVTAKIRLQLPVNDTQSDFNKVLKQYFYSQSRDNYRINSTFYTNLIDTKQLTITHEKGINFQLTREKEKLLVNKIENIPMGLKYDKEHKKLIPDETGEYKFNYAIIYYGTGNSGHYFTLYKDAHGDWYKYDYGTNQKIEAETGRTVKQIANDYLSNAVYLHYEQ